MTILLGCNGTDTVLGTGEGNDSIPIVTVDISDKKQFIRNFGASDAWVCQYVGMWPDEKRQQVAEWLFSKELDEEGNPKGIGLSLWRFNIGAGSAAQTNISDPWRRTEGFLRSDDGYDWTKQQGEQWFLRQAKNYEVENLLAFTNSPPIQLTRNGKAYSSMGTEANISKENYLPFARFLVDVIEHFEREAISFDFISPFNEPQWDWTGNGQEGSPYTNKEMYNITRILDSVLSKSSVATRIQIGEAGKLNYLYEKADKNTRGNQISEFFSSSSPTYLGNLSRVDKTISGHSYFTSHPIEILNSVRENVAREITESEVPIEFLQSEYCLLGDQEEINPNGIDLGMDPALYVARIIHHDLTVANASAWSWWLAVSAYDYKDGLIYVDKNTTNGNVRDSKTLWAFGNFSRFIRPNAQRIGLSSQSMNINNPRGVMISAYLNSNNELVIVAINYSNLDTKLKLDLTNNTVSHFAGFITGPSDDANLKSFGPGDISNGMILPRRSIVTLIGAIE